MATFTQNAVEINDLPEEMLLEVFQYLNFSHDRLLMQYSKICVHWREIIARYIVAPRIAQVASSNVEFKKLLEKNGWTEECVDAEMLHFIYNKTMNPITSKLTATISYSG